MGQQTSESWTKWQKVDLKKKKKRKKERKKEREDLFVDYFLKNLYKKN